MKVVVVAYHTLLVYCDARRLTFFIPAVSMGLGIFAPFQRNSYRKYNPTEKNTHFAITASSRQWRRVHEKIPHHTFTGEGGLGVGT